jgi:hypothetical protein
MCSDIRSRPKRSSDWLTKLAEAVWQGRVDDGVEAIGLEPIDRGVAEADELPEDDPLRPLANAARYFTNNRDRMDYPRYRREGLPLTSSPPPRPSVHPPFASRLGVIS